MIGRKEAVDEKKQFKEDWSEVIGGGGDHPNMFKRELVSDRFYTMPSNDVDDRAAFLKAMYGDARHDKDRDSKDGKCPFIVEDPTDLERPPPDPASEMWWLGSHGDVAFDPRQ